MAVRHISDHQGHPSAAIFEVSVGIKDMESQGKRFGFPMSAFNFQRSDHHVEVDLRRGFTHPSMISVWNGPRWTLSHTITSSSMLTSGDPPLAPSSGVSALSGAGTAVPNWQDSSHATLVVDHSVVRLSISFSWITLISLLIVQIPTTKGTLCPKSDSSGTTRNTASLSYPAIPCTGTRKMTNLSRLVRIPPSPTRFTG